MVSGVRTATRLLFCPIASNQGELKCPGIDAETLPLLLIVFAYLVSVTCVSHKPAKSNCCESSVCVCVCVCVRVFTCAFDSAQLES
jgi:hypothetical protein